MYMNSVVSGNLTTAKRGGVPGTFSLVKGYYFHPRVIILFIEGYQVHL